MRIFVAAILLTIFLPLHKARFTDTKQPSPIVIGKNIHVVVFCSCKCRYKILQKLFYFSRAKPNGKHNFYFKHSLNNCSLRKMV